MTVTDMQEQAEQIVSESISGIAKRYGISSQSLMASAVREFPNLKSQPRVENSGPRYTATGNPIPAGTQIGIQQYQVAVLEMLAGDCRNRSQRRNGTCRIVRQGA